MTLKIAKGLLLATTLLCASSHASVAHFTLTGVPGEYISQGLAIDNIFSSADPLLDWNSVTVYPASTSPSPAPATDFLRFIFAMKYPNPSKLTFLDFSTRAMGVALTEGMTYTDAQRASLESPGHPGLEVNYDHRGCNKVRGSFKVEKLAFKGNALDVFSASFTQSCDSSPFVNGSFYYNASLTALPTNAVPEPGSLALLGLGIAGLGIARRRKQAR